MLQVAALAALGAAAVGIPTAKADDSTNMVTWSISGSTAMRNFTVGVPGTSAGGLSILETPLALSLSNGTYDAGTAGLQLAPLSFNSGNPLGTGMGAGVRVEWHEAGSVEGILELANDQIGYAGGAGGTPIVDPNTPRNPTGGNPLWLNRNRLTAVGGANGYSIATSTYNTYSNYNAAGKNLQGGQNRVQMAIADVVPLQGFSKTSGNAPAGGTPAFGLRPGDSSYGKGNLALQSNVTSGIGIFSSRQALVDDSLLNMPTSNLDPATGLAYGTGAWNTAGVGNLASKTVAITATVFAANPGTGLTNVNKTDAQWLQTTGRLKNGVDFNMTERDVNSGTRNVAALNTGVDPAWAVGENDGGNGFAGGVTQASIGASMKFSGKTAGGGLLRPTIQNNRMAIGVLGMSDAIGSVKNNTNTAPLRALAYSNTADSETPVYIQPTTTTITDGTYVIWQKEQYITVYTPDVSYGNDDVAKGGANGDIVKLRNNVLASVNAHFPNPATFNDPADQLLANSFLLPQMMLIDKATDGGSTSDVSGNMVNGQTHSQWRSAALAEPTVTTNFNTVAAGSITAGVGANYGVTSAPTSLAAGAVNIPITAQDVPAGTATTGSFAAGGNYLFGNFNQNGVRDFDAVKKAQAAQAALFASDANGAAAVDVNNIAVSNGNKVLGISTTLDNMNGHTGPSKGDLVVMGDYNGDGKFDGKDLYAMARGAAVSDASGTGFTNGTLTATPATFGDAIRTAELRKNAALDYMQGAATAQQKIDASANLTSDPTGTNAFNKADINRDGLVNRQDAQIVDSFIGKDYRNLSDQLGAVVRTDINPAGTAFANGGTALDPTDPANSAIARKSISLVDVELNDTGNIDKQDFSIIRTAVGAGLRDGDADFDGDADGVDIGTWATNFTGELGGAGDKKWSQGDWDVDGDVDGVDAGLWATAFTGELGGGGLGSIVVDDPSIAPGAAAILRGMGITVVPEPASIGLMAIGLAGAAGMRRRGRRK
jgi:hypothetical protein